MSPTVCWQWVLLFKPIQALGSWAGPFPRADTTQHRWSSLMNFTWCPLLMEFPCDTYSKTTERVLIHSLSWKHWQCFRDNPWIIHNPTWFRHNPTWIPENPLVVKLLVSLFGFHVAREGLLRCYEISNQTMPTTELELSSHYLWTLVWINLLFFCPNQACYVVVRWLLAGNRGVG